MNIEKIKCINTFTLKLIAIIAMTIDHAGLMFGLDYIDGLYYYGDLMSSETYELMRNIGRIAFPIFCYMIVEGFFYTKSVTKYILRLGVFALISQIPFNLLVYRTPWEKNCNLNVYFTLLLGLITIAAIDECIAQCKESDYKDKWLIGAAAIIALVIMSLADNFHTDYGSYGVLLILVFYIFRNKPIFLCVVMYLVTYWYTENNFSESQLYAVYSLVFILLHNRKKGPSMKYLFYTYYPLHLTLFFLLWKFVI